MSDCCPESVIEEAPCQLVVEDDCTVVVSYETGPQGPAGPPGPGVTPVYGSYLSEQDQTAALNTPTSVTLDTVVLSSGILLAGGSQIIPQSDGVYDLQFSLQMHHRGGGGSGEHVWIWLARGGVAEPASATKLTVPNGRFLVPAWDFMFSAVAGEAFEVMWLTDNTQIALEHFTAAAPLPAIPSAIITVFKVAD